MSAQRQPEKKVRQNTGMANLLPPWKPGQSGNPAGRPVGSRQLIAGEFLTDALADWKENGKAAFAALATEKPEEYLRLMAEVAQLTAKPNEREPQVIDARPIFDIGGLIGQIAARGSGHSSAAALPDRSVLAPDGSVESTGRGEAMDSGSLPGGGA